MLASLRSLRAEPAVADAPPRVWRDWVLVGLAMPTAVLEAVLRDEVPWRWASLVVALAIIPLLLWRRTHPLPVLLTAFGVSLAVGVAHAIWGGDGTVGLNALGVMIILPYAVARWGSGRDVVTGSGVAFGSAIVFSIIDWTNVGDLIGGFAVLTLAVTLGLAVRFRGREHERALEQVRSQEREHLARDLHDTVAHHVSAIAIRAQAGLATSGTDPDAATDALRVIEAEATRTLTEMRAMIGLLRRDDPAARAPVPELGDLRRLADGAVGGPPVAVEIRGDVGEVSPAVATAVFRLAQESVTNARRHARNATRIVVGVVVDDGDVRLRVGDDGDPAGARPASGGYGIQGMIERADLLGGECRAGPEPDGGWTVTAVIPRRAEVPA